MLKLLILWCLECLWCLSDLIIKPRMLSYKKGYLREVDSKKFDEQIYRKRAKQIFRIRSDYGYMIVGEYIDGSYKNKVKSDIEEDKKVKSNEVNKNNKKIVILCHGLGYARYGSIKYIEMFLQLGFSVVIYDHRNHGQSGKAHTSMGFYEKYDLQRVVDWCYEQHGEDCTIVTHGESMGAATVLLHLGIDNRVKCAIADCAYSDLRQLLRHQLKQYYHLPYFLISIESMLTYLRAGFWYQQVSPIKVVSQTDIPILFIHGKVDNFVPATMSQQMYQAKKKNKALFLVAKARHAESYCKNKESYEKTVGEFLKTYLK